jgi:hypothetical protein
MIDINLLREKVKGRTVGIVVLGKSIYELEKRIDEFKDQDILWVGLGQFDIIKFLKFDIVFDTASVPEGRLKIYEPIRIARLDKYLSENHENIWITSSGLKRDVIVRLKYDLFWMQHENRILFVDSLFPRDRIAKFMEVPNSLTLCIGAMIAGLAKKIIVFGCDGYNGDVSVGAESYYKSEEVKAERQAALGSIEDPGINRDTNIFQKKFKEFYNLYASYFDNTPDIYNCSTESIYTCMRKIDYNQAIEVAKGNELEIERGDGWHLI